MKHFDVLDSRIYSSQIGAIKPVTYYISPELQLGFSNKPIKYSLLLGALENIKLSRPFDEAVIMFPSSIEGWTMGIRVSDDEKDLVFFGVKKGKKSYDVYLSDELAVMFGLEYAEAMMYTCIIMVSELLIDNAELEKVSDAVLPRLCIEKGPILTATNSGKRKAGHYMVLRSKKETKALGGKIGVSKIIEHTCAFSVCGHWRRLSNSESMGSDRFGNATKGKTWVKPYTKGKGKEFIEKVRVLIK